MSNDPRIASRGHAAPARRSDSVSDERPKPRTLPVLALLALTALTFSYLAAYAIYDALAATNVIDRFRGPDPRPRWLATGFCVLMLLFTTVGAVFRRLWRNDLRAIDAMADDDDAG